MGSLINNACRRPLLPFIPLRRDSSPRRRPSSPRCTCKSTRPFRLLDRVPKDRPMMAISMAWGAAYAKTTNGYRDTVMELATDVTVFRDDRAYIPLSNVLKDDDAILLLTPVVVPPRHHETSTIDPFECFGRAMASRHPRVRHVPYTAQGGITDYHMVHISMAQTVIFLISGAPIASQPSQLDIAHTALTAVSSRPYIVVVCYGAGESTLKETSFATIVRVPRCSPEALETAAAALFGQNRPRIRSIEPHLQWLIEVLPDEWSQFDMSPIEKLWKTCLPPRYHLSSYVLRSLLDRGGFSRHYVVKSPNTGQTIGFCATYTTFINSDNTGLVGSLAMLLVEHSNRGRGIGSALHRHALSELKKTRGVRRLQLGSTFPRLLYGTPEDLSSTEWFRRRGWALDFESDGQGRIVRDWVLNIGDWPSGNFSAAMEGFTFRICHGDEHDKVMHFIRDESLHDNTMGLHDQYAASAPFDIVLGLYGTTIVATALAYFPRSGTQAEMDLPWAASIGYDVGGVTCICIAGSSQTVTTRKDAIMFRLLNTCIRSLDVHGMQRVFLDGMRGGQEGFQSIGGQEWARYREAWQPV